MPLLKYFFYSEKHETTEFSCTEWREDPFTFWQLLYKFRILCANTKIKLKNKPMDNTHDQFPSRYDHIEMLDQETMDMLKEYSHGNPEIVQDIIDSFEPEASSLMEEIKTAVDTKNDELLRTSSHALAGISGSIGAVRLRKIASETENAIKTGSPQDAYNLTDMLYKTYDDLIAMLKKM